MDELNVKAFLAKATERPKYLPLEVEGLGTVYIKRLTAGEKDNFEQATPGKATRRAITVAHCCFDDRGARIFSDADVPTLEIIDAAAIDPIVIEALRFNGYTKEEQDALLKNSNGQAVSS